jgi:hypothetical protein
MMKYGFALACLVSLIGTMPLLSEETDGWIELFNGKDMSGWKIAEHPDAFQVEDGKMVVFGPRAHAFYVGPDGNASFKNFHFQADVMTTPGSNSGIYFHTQYQNQGWPSRGYEAQVNQTHRDPKKTGGLYNVQDNYEVPAKDNEWFKYEIIVEGKHIVVKIDGKTISDYTEPGELDRPDRQLSSGTFALQAHDPMSKVYYRNLRVKPLPS